MKMAMGKVAGVLAIVGAILLLVAMFLGWYTIQISESGDGISVTGQELMLPGSSYQSNFGGNVTTQSYSSTNATNFGNVMMATQYLLIGGFIVALLGGVLYFASSMRGRQSWAKPAMILLVIALLLAVAAPAYVAAASPGAFKADVPSQETNGSGPWSSFSGSCSNGAGCFGGTGGGTFAGVSGTTTWGPAAGWYIAWVAFVILLVSVILLWRAQRTVAAHPEAPIDAAPPSPTDTYSMETPVPPTAPPGGGQ